MAREVTREARSGADGSGTNQGRAVRSPSARIVAWGHSHGGGDGTARRSMRLLRCSGTATAALRRRFATWTGGLRRPAPRGSPGPSASAPPAPRRRGPDRNPEGPRREGVLRRQGAFGEAAVEAAEAPAHEPGPAGAAAAGEEHEGGGEEELAPAQDARRDAQAGHAEGAVAFVHRHVPAAEAPALAEHRAQVEAVADAHHGVGREDERVPGALHAPAVVGVLERGERLVEAAHGLVQGAAY